MGQLGFFDLNRRYECLIERNDPLVAIGAMVPFESFRPKLHAALIKGELRRSEVVPMCRIITPAGRLTARMTPSSSSRPTFSKCWIR
jgi:hypothetical protein